MNKRFLIVICSLLLLAGVSSAEMPFYTVQGTVYVTEEGGDIIPTREVVFYRDMDGFNAGQTVTTETDVSGYFELNAIDLWYFYDIPITPETQSYFLAVSSSETEPYTTYGTWEMIYLSAVMGYTEEALVIMANGWVGAPTEEAEESEVLAIITEALPVGTEEGDYLAEPEATGGTLPYSWTIEEGSLPGGLTLAVDTGTISGTLESGTAGTYEVTLLVTDALLETAFRLLTLEVLVLGEEAPPEVFPGTVPLYIGRSGSDIMITWEAGSYPTPEVYYLTGDGGGSFTNEADQWTLIDPISPPSGFDFTDYVTGSFLHTDQVGLGSAEVYYRALESGEESSLLSSAESVGKFNKTLYADWSFLASPFESGNFDDVLGTDFTAGDQIWVWDDSSQSFYSPATFSDNTWGTTYSFETGKGVLFYLNTDTSKDTTLLGAVGLSSFAYTIYDEWNLIGNPYPMVTDLDSFVAGEQGDQLWIWSDSEQSFSSPLTFDGTDWPEGSTLEAGRAYGYMR